jgi:hypothetical protein
MTGECRDPDGNPYTGTPPHFTPIDNVFPSDTEMASTEYFAPDIDQDGHMSLTLPPGYYAVVETEDMEPYLVPHTIVDLRNGAVTGLIIDLQYRPTPLPVTPPRADLIQVGAADVDGYATVTGLPGAVAPNSAVGVVNLNAHTLAIALSDASGAFSTSIFAPAGSSLLIKYDPRGDQVALALSKSSETDIPGEGAMNPLPGTILEVGDTPAGDGTIQTFNSVGAWTEETEALALSRTVDVQAQSDRWAGWWITGTLQAPGQPVKGTVSNTAWDGLSVQPGDTISVTFHLRMTSPDLNCTEPLTYTPSIEPILQAEFGADGWAEYWGMWFTSYMFTPTGLPIERETFGEKVPLGTGTFTNLTCVSDQTFKAELSFAETLPTNIPAGIYVPYAELEHGGVPLGLFHHIPVWYDYLPGRMPPLQVGAPEPPRIPWTLLGDYPINGYRGVLAREDMGHFAMPTRVVHPPDQFVIPRLDERSGEPIAYRLEPGSNWLSSSDRRQPNPLHIPLAFPSGELSVEVLKPDGSKDQLGPSPIVQSSQRTPTIPGGTKLDEGTGLICDIYRLTTLADAFAYTFDQYGHHIVVLEGYVEDIYGSTYAIQGTYDLYVARVLDLDPAQLPTTPFEQGDAFAPGLHIFPPVPADVVIHITHMPYSDPTQAITATVTGQANRFGYFQPPVGVEIPFDAPGEFRVDISAAHEAPDGTLWMGAMTWGNVVEGPAAMIEAHGRRGLDDVAIRLPWFEVRYTPYSEEIHHVNYPYFSGDIHWGNEEEKPAGDSIQAIITVRDTTSTEIVYDLMRTFATRQHAYVEGDLEEQIAMGEAPLFTTSSSVHDPGLFPEDVELWSYWYGSSERPDVRVREVVNIGNMPTAYWRFDDTYGYQIGEPADGDQLGDIKWEFGGAVFRVISDTNPINEYAIYSSFWVLLPHECDAFGCTRVTPPFQDTTGGSINGGPIMTLLGEEIDMLFLPKGVRPGDVLERDDVVSFSGHVGPPLDSQVSVTITPPSGSANARSGTWHANRIGWLYDPSFDFAADEVGRWMVDVSVLHDRPYLPTGVTPTSHNTGTVLGTTGRYEFYVVEPDSPELHIAEPLSGFINWPNYKVEPIEIQGRAPTGTTAIYYTIHDKGIVMDQGSVIPGPGGTFSLVYDAKALHEDFPMLSLTAHEGRWEGLADEVSIHLLAVGEEAPRAATVTLIGEEVFVHGGEDPGGFYPIYLPLVTKQ